MIKIIIVCAYSVVRCAILSGKKFWDFSDKIKILLRSFPLELIPLVKSIPSRRLITQLI